MHPLQLFLFEILMFPNEYFFFFIFIAFIIMLSYGLSTNLASHLNLSFQVGYLQVFLSDFCCLSFFSHCHFINDYTSNSDLQFFVLIFKLLLISLQFMRSYLYFQI